MSAIARSGDLAFAPLDAHGCPSCPHPVTGFATGGAPTVFVEGTPALTLGDGGAHVACCGPNSWSVSAGSRSVYVEGRPVARRGDETSHCGGKGSLTSGAVSVFAG